MDFVPDKDFVLPDGTRLDKQKYVLSVHEAHRNKFFSFDSLADNYTHCFAAPIYDNHSICVGTLCLVAPKQDAKSNYRMYREVLKNASTLLTDKLQIDE